MDKIFISTPHYVVHYKDDFKRRHLTFVKTMSEIRFIEERFEILFFEYVS